jgi:hypothetical protein
MMLEPDRDQIEIFAEALFRHAERDGFVSVRGFFEDDSAKPFRISSAGLKGGLRHLIEVAVDDARRAAQHPRPVVFCPPLAVFANNTRAREQDIAVGLALSVECDAHPREARAALEGILGPATVIVKSGGCWTNGNGEADDKLHLHWRLKSPAQGGDLTKLKQARDLAARLVGGDPSNKPVCHPIRWPGSWHRKAKPRLCRIETLDADREIDLDIALAALRSATLSSATSGNGNGTGKDKDEAPPSSWAALINNIVTGTSYHGALVPLAAKMLVGGMSDGGVVNMLRALMESANGPHDERWLARYTDIPRTVSTAREKYAERAANSTAAGTNPRSAARTWRRHHRRSIY